MRLGFKFFTVAIIALIISYSSRAQLCQGSLGDPIVNITFGAGSNPGPQLAAATTAYQFVTNDCPNDGYYSVRNNTSACFTNSWHTLNSDHTGNANGYFMLVNASFAPSAFYIDTVKGLCGNTTYQFAAWIVNVLTQSACMGNGIRPNLTFSIENLDGTVLQTYKTSDITSTSSPLWQQFGFFFKTPVSVSDVVLRIFNNAPGGCGNDIALDDITFRACGPKLEPAISNSSSLTAAVCQGSNKSFSFVCAVSAGFNNPVLQWQQSFNNGAWTDVPGATSNKLTQTFIAVTPLGNYNYRLSAAETGNEFSPSCKIFSQPLVVQVVVNPIVSATNSGPLCAGATLQLNASGGVTYAWSGVNNFTASASPASIVNVQQSNAGKYYVLGTDVNGCSGNDSTIVSVKQNPVASTVFSSATICSGESIQLKSTGNDNYSWSPANGLSATNIADPIASPSITTLYIVTVTNQFACSDTASVNIIVSTAPSANAGPDRTIIKGDIIKLSGTATGESITYSWSPQTNINNSQALQPMVNPSADIDYILKVESTNGCGIAIDTMHVFVYGGIFIPKAFSPNGDGLNDTWRIPSLAAFPLFEMSVFNRFGQLVFKNSKANTPWDGMYKGTPAPSGAYVYVIDLKQAPGILKGTLLIVR